MMVRMEHAENAISSVNCVMYVCCVDISVYMFVMKCVCECVSVCM